MIHKKGVTIHFDLHPKKTTYFLFLSNPKYICISSSPPFSGMYDFCKNDPSRNYIYILYSADHVFYYDKHVFVNKIFMLARKMNGCT